MVTCPQCSHENLDGTAYCEDCGCDLVGIESDKGAAAPASSFSSPSSPKESDGDQFSPASAAEPVAAPAPIASAATEAPGQPRLVVVRGVKPNEEFALWDGDNVIGRLDDKPVDIDLEAQESQDRQWVSRQHARIRLDGGVCTLEDMASGNGTFVNRGSKLQVGQSVELNNGDMIQIGTVHLKYVT
jgi:hypothetical protein